MSFTKLHKAEHDVLIRALTWRRAWRQFDQVKGRPDGPEYTEWLKRYQEATRELGDAADRLHEAQVTDKA